MWVTSMYFRAVFWFARTEGGGGSCAEGGAGEVVGFSMTVPNWEKVDWVRSSMGMRMVGEGMGRGMLAVCRRLFIVVVELGSYKSGGEVGALWKSRGDKIN
jgi:hypothetical protein